MQTTTNDTITSKHKPMPCTKPCTSKPVNKQSLVPPAEQRQGQERYHASVNELDTSVLIHGPVFLSILTLLHSIIFSSILIIGPKHPYNCSRTHIDRV